MVRKGLKFNFDISHDGSMETFKALFKIHDDNIRAVNGTPKPIVFLN